MNFLKNILNGYSYMIYEHRVYESYLIKFKIMLKVVVLTKESSESKNLQVYVNKGKLKFNFLSYFIIENIQRIFTSLLYYHFDKIYVIKNYLFIFKYKRKFYKVIYTVMSKHKIF